MTGPRTPATPLYINDPNQAIKYCKVHYFADETNILCLSSSIKKLKKLVNADLKRLDNWLNANKISLNIKKTKMVIFKSKKNKFEGDLKIKLSGKRLYPTESIKYLSLKTVTNRSFSWQNHHQFLIYGLIFPQTSLTMKPQVLHRVTSQNFFIRQIDIESIQ